MGFTAKTQRTLSITPSQPRRLEDTKASHAKTFQSNHRRTETQSRHRGFSHTAESVPVFDRHHRGNGRSLRTRAFSPTDRFPGTPRPWRVGPACFPLASRLVASCLGGCDDAMVFAFVAPSRFYSSSQQGGGSSGEGTLPWVACWYFCTAAMTVVGRPMMA